MMSGASMLPGRLADHAQALLAGDLRHVADPVRPRDRVVRGAGAAWASGRHPGLHVGDLPGDPPVPEQDRARLGVRGHAARRSRRSASSSSLAAVEPQGNKYATMTGKGFRPRQIDLGPWRWFTAALFIVYFLLIVVLPFLVLLWSSFQKFYSVPSMAALKNLTLEPYRFILTYPNDHAIDLEQPRAVVRHGDDRHAADVGHLLDRGQDEAPRTLAARQPRVAADGLPRPGARPVDHDLLPERRRSACTGRCGSC